MEQSDSLLRHYFHLADDKWKLLRSLLLPAVICILIARYCWKKRRYWYLAFKIPGPTPLPIIGNILMFVTKSLVGCFKTINQITENYGPIVRIWGAQKHVVLITDAESIEKIMKNKSLDNRGAYVYKVGKPIFNNGLILSNGKTWRFHRKIINSAFHANILDGFVHKFATHSLILNENLKAVSNGSTFDLYPYTFLCSTDIIADTTMDEAVNVQRSQDHNFTKVILMGLEVCVERFRKPWLLNDWTYSLTKLGKEMKLIMKYTRENICYYVKQRKCKFNKYGKKKTDLDDKESVSKTELCLLDLMIENETMSMEEICDEVITILSAGSETTATAFCYALCLLGIHHDVQERVLEEQKLIFGEDKYRPVCSADLSQMTYLEQVIKETLRLFPPIPYLMRSLTEDTEVGMGYTIPAGSYCVVNVYLTHRNPEYYQNPTAFLPERFSAENSVDRHPYVFIPFGGGRRSCVGNRYSMLKLKTMLSTVLRRYRVVDTPGGRKEIEENLEVGLVMKPKRGFQVQVLLRD
ncbi:hypothetical protein ANN_10010 [Periplaneta americana]|uniref:Cytochrome P450 n=1 Tax=Periplaneta americana TaxID=6978 RepID=A0ABQ8TMZ8_PERAM|nr:hypothetical protein ANN_10010 [Periplaneta americana]